VFGGFYTFDRLLKEWRDHGDMEGLFPRDMIQWRRRASFCRLRNSGTFVSKSSQ